MNILFFLLLTFFSLSLLAHPDEKEPLSNIGVGSALIALADINVPPNTISVVLGRVLKDDHEHSCQLVLKQTAAYDRVIKAGRMLRIITTGVIFKFYDRHIHWDGRPAERFKRHEVLYFDNPKLNYLICDVDFPSANRSKLKAVSLETFREIVEGKLEIQMASPQEI